MSGNFLPVVAGRKESTTIHRIAYRAQTDRNAHLCEWNSRIATSRRSDNGDGAMKSEQKKQRGFCNSVIG